MVIGLVGHHEVMIIMDRRSRDPKFVQGCQELKINDDGILLKMAWDWKLQNLPDFQIRQKLSIRGLRINKQTLSAMWRNPFYCGIHKNTFLGGEVVEGNWKGSSI